MKSKVKPPVTFRRKQEKRRVWMIVLSIPSIVGVTLLILEQIGVVDNLTLGWRSTTLHMLTSLLIGMPQGRTSTPLVRFSSLLAVVGEWYSAYMSRSIEVELKFEILKPEEVAAFVRDMPILEQKHIVDTYLDTKTGDLFKKGVFIRIRNGKKFDIKFNKDEVHLGLEESVDHTHCDEVSSPLPLTAESLPAINEALEFLRMVPLNEPSLDEFKAANKLIDSMIIDKERTSYDDGEFHIDVDTVKNLGTFLEIEKMTDEHADRQQIAAAMYERLQGLDLHHVDTGYNELYWRKYNFDLYLQGKYLLIEDRQKYRPHTIKQ